MARTVFYSWQSDIQNRVNRNFIEDALRRAIEELGQSIGVDSALRDEKLIIDKDTLGVPGSPPIVEAIFSKISRCAVFVPDMTFIATSDNGRRLPNPNVLIEYGWALSELGNRHILPIMNTAFGAPSWESLPFDMRHLRFPLTYELVPGCDSETKSAARAALVKELKLAIQAILNSEVISDEKKSREHTNFSSAVPTANASTFIPPEETFGTEPGGYGSDETILFLPDVQRLFLRLIPATDIPAIGSSKQALEMIREGKLGSLGDNTGRAGRNKHGAFVANYKESGELRNFTQLFKSKEVWGVDTRIDKAYLTERSNLSFGYFPSEYLEETFERAMANYLSFAEHTLQLEPPLRFIAGATDVVGYRMTAPQGMNFGGFEKFAGQVVDNELVYEGEIESFDTDASDVMKPFFDFIWQECGLERPSNEN